MGICTCHRVAFGEAVDDNRMFGVLQGGGGTWGAGIANPVVQPATHTRGSRNLSFLEPTGLSLVLYLMIMAMVRRGGGLIAYSSEMNCTAVRSHSSHRSFSSSGESIAPVGLAGEESINPLIGRSPARARSF